MADLFLTVVVLIGLSYGLAILGAALLTAIDELRGKL